MADNASIARPYAKAVFELAQKDNTHEAWAEALNKLAMIGSDDDFSALVNDPRFDRQQIIDLVTDLSKDALPEGGDNLIKLLVENDRLSVLPDINSQYTELVAKATAHISADVVTAKALTDAQKALLEEALQTRLGMKVTLSETVEANLVGGAIIKAGDLVIDGSAKGRIEKLASALAR